MYTVLEMMNGAAEGYARAVELFAVRTPKDEDFERHLTDVKRAAWNSSRSLARPMT